MDDKPPTRPSAGNVPPALMAGGDAVSILLFAALGRNAHHDVVGGPVAGTLGVAAPFLIGWFAATYILYVYMPGRSTSIRPSLLAASRAWLLGCAFGLVIRSVQRGRVAPPGFALVTFFFVLALFFLWRLFLFYSLPLVLSLRRTQ